jgi:hypothetical protein
MRNCGSASKEQTKHKPAPAHTSRKRTSGFSSSNERTPKQKAAEEHASAAQRKQAEAEREARELRAENEKLHARVERLQAEADVLSELNARIETAKHTGDLFPR